jgi:hypothetical protein
LTRFRTGRSSCRRAGGHDDLVGGRDGQYRVRLMDNKDDRDGAYPSVEVLPGGTFVTTTDGHWEQEKAPYTLSVRSTLKEPDTMARRSASPRTLAPDLQR